MNVNLIGPYPPPYGGVSTHIRRLRARLLRDGHECTVWCHEDKPVKGVRALGPLRAAYARLKHLPNNSILHFHSQHLLAGALAGRRTVFTAHNERINHLLRGGRFPLGWCYRLLARNRFRRLRHVIAVSDRARDDLVCLGVDRQAICVINAYLRPDPEEIAHPLNLEALAAFRQRFGRLVTANASAQHYFRGEDLYGIDLCIQALSRLRQRQPDLGLVLALPQGRGTTYLAHMQEMAEKLGVSERILWLLESGAYHPILAECDLFVRPSNTDGFCISIAEAFEFGVPVVASDAVPRPPGCVLFRNRDLEDFVTKTDEALRRLPQLARLVEASRESDHYEQIVQVYERLTADA